MKRFFVSLAMAGIATTVFFACGSKKEENNEEEESAYGAYEIAEPEGGKTEEETPATTEETTTTATVNPELIAEGKALVEGSDCKTCHKVTDKIIGPSYTEVAQKYEDTEANVKTLAEKILKGGSGVWGAIAMTPHPTVSQEDAEKMVHYILSLAEAQE